MFLRGSVDLGKLWLYAVIIRFCKLNWKQIGENLYVLSSIIWNFSFAEMHFVHSCDVDTVQVQVNLSKVLYATHKNSRKNMVENSEIAGKIVMLWLSTKRNYCDSNYATFRLPWVHSLHCPSKKFFLFFAVHLRISSFFRWEFFKWTAKWANPW